MESKEVTGVGLVARLRRAADAPGMWGAALLREAADSLEAAERQLEALRAPQNFVQNFVLRDQADLGRMLNAAFPDDCVVSNGARSIPQIAQVVIVRLQQQVVQLTEERDTLKELADAYAAVRERERDRAALEHKQPSGGAFVRALIPVRVWHDGAWRAATIDSYDLARMRRAVTSERALAAQASSRLAGNDDEAETHFDYMVEVHLPVPSPTVVRGEVQP